MLKSLIIIHNVTFATQTEAGNIHGFIYDASKNDLVSADFKLGIGTKTPPLTEKKLKEAQDAGYYIDYPVTPKLGETAYWLELDDNAVVTKIYPYLTDAQMAEYRKRRDAEALARAKKVLSNNSALLEAMRGSVIKAETGSNELVDALFTIPKKGGNK